MTSTYVSPYTPLFQSSALPAMGVCCLADGVAAELSVVVAAAGGLGEYDERVISHADTSRMRLRLPRSRWRAPIPAPVRFTYRSWIRDILLYISLWGSLWHWQLAIVTNFTSMAHGSRSEFVPLPFDFNVLLWIFTSHSLVICFRVWWFYVCCPQFRAYRILYILIMIIHFVFCIILRFFRGILPFFDTYRL